MKRRAAIAATVAAFAAGAGDAHAQAMPVVHIGIIPSEFAAQPWYAEELGLFTKAGLAADLVSFTSGAAGIAALVSGSLDLVYSNVVSTGTAIAKGISVGALAAANIYSPQAWGSGVLAVKRTSRLSNAASFSGTTIAVGGLHNVTELGARVWLDKNGGDSSKVRWIEMPDPEMEAAVMSGRVDAAVMSAGVYPRLGKESYPIRIVALAMGSISPTFTLGVWASSKEWVQQHPIEARKLIGILNASAEWANGHRHDSAVILAKYTKRPLSAIEASVRYVFGTELTPASLQSQIDAAAKYGWLKSFPARKMILTVPN